MSSRWRWGRLLFLTTQYPSNKNLDTAFCIAIVNNVNIYRVNMAYAKLFSTITDSSLWGASKEARILFVSMLARADAVGFIEAALPGLARMANLTIAETERALAEIMAPDPHSKSTNADGRRVVKVERGWCLVNYEAYRLRRDEEERREYMRKYMSSYRKGHPVNSVNSSKLSKPQLAKAEAEAEAEREKKGNLPTPHNEPADENQPITLAKPMGPATPKRGLPDFLAMNRALFIGREERADWEAILRQWGWDACEAAARALAKAAARGTKIYRSDFVAWLDDHYELTNDDESATT